jgi:hypothetical protein
MSIPYRLRLVVTSSFSFTELDCAPDLVFIILVQCYVMNMTN